VTPINQLTKKGIILFEKNYKKEKEGVAAIDIKKRPNYKIYLQVLRQMPPEKRLIKAFELSEFSRQLFIHGLHKRFPNLSDEEFKKILLERLDKCHNRNY
jgi:hypothetical protein